MTGACDVARPAKDMAQKRMNESADKNKQAKQRLDKTRADEDLTAEGLRKRIQQSVTIDELDDKSEIADHVSRDKAAQTTDVDDTKQRSQLETSSDLLLDTPHLSCKAPSILPSELGQEKRYQMQHLLGKGGMGKVYSFRDANLRRDVAIKSMKNHDSSNQRVIASFVNEARITASLEHSGVLPVHDLDFTESGEVYYTMRQVQGVSVGEAIESAAAGTVSEQIATINDRINIMLKVCDTLELAHQRSILHRDIKPDNIMLGAYGEVYVVDWGTALSLDEESSSRGNRVGTPLYMSPEQARREAPGIVNEVYSIGATLFHLLFLRFPLFAESMDYFWERKKIGEIDEPSQEERAAISDSLLAIVKKALAPDPADRYQSAAALAKDLRLYQAGLAVSAFNDSAVAFMMRWYRRNKKAVLSALIIAVPLLIILGFGFAALQSMQAERMRHWDLLFEDDFQRDQVGNNWEMVSGRADIIDDNLVISGTSSVYARLLIPHNPVVRLEYEAMIPVGTNTCDMSAYMFTTPGKYDSYNEPLGYLFGFGISNNSLSVLRRSGSMMSSTQSKLITPGKWHRVVCEKDVSSVRLLVDDEVVFSVKDHYPPRFDEEMYAVLYTYKSTMHIRRVKLYGKTIAERARTIDIADELFWSGEYAVGARLYGMVWNSHRYTELGASALFGSSLCLIEQGKREEAIEQLQLLSTEKGADGLRLSAKLKIAELYFLEHKFAEGLSCAQQAMQGLHAIQNYPEIVTFFDQALSNLRQANPDDEQAFMSVFDDYCEWWLDIYPAHATIANGRFWGFWSEQHRARLGDWDAYKRIIKRGLQTLGEHGRKSYFEKQLFMAEWRGVWNAERLQAALASGQQSIYWDDLFAMQQFEQLHKALEPVLQSSTHAVGDKHYAQHLQRSAYEVEGRYDELQRLWGDDQETMHGQNSLAVCLLVLNQGQAVLDLLQPRWEEIEVAVDGKIDFDNKWRNCFIAYALLNDQSALERFRQAYVQAKAQGHIVKGSQWQYACLESVESAEAIVTMVQSKWSDRSQNSGLFMAAESQRLFGNHERARTLYRATMKPPYSFWDVIAERRLATLEAASTDE